MQSNPNRQQLQACNPTRARPEKRPHRGVELPCTPGDSGSDLEQKKRHVSVCVQGQHVQLQCSCVNEQHRAFSHYHSTPFFLTPPHLNSCCHPPHSLPIPPRKACFPTIVGTGGAVDLGWGAGWERPSRLDMSRCLRH